MSQTVTVSIPTALRPQAGNNASVNITGESVKQVLANLSSQFPELGKRLFRDGADGSAGSGGSGGEINRFINVYVNDEDIRFLENLETKLKAGDELSIVPAIAGG